MLLTVQSMRSRKKYRGITSGPVSESNEIVEEALPTSCESVTSEDRYLYTFGPEMMSLGDTTIRAWGGKSDSDKGQDRELHVCSHDRCVFVILDGHGESDQIAQRAKEEICARLPKMIDAASVRREIAGVAEVTNKLLHASYSGSTLAGIVVQQDSVVVFNAGDSPIVWTGESLLGGIIGGSEDHDCRNEAEKDRIRKHQGMGKEWNPCHEANGLRMINGGTMTTRGLGDKPSLRFGFSQRPAVQTLSLPKKGKSGPHWFILSSDGIVSDTSATFKMQLALSREEMVRYVADGFDGNGTDIGVRERIAQMFALGNAFPVSPFLTKNQRLKGKTRAEEIIPAALLKSPWVKKEFPPGSHEEVWYLKQEILDRLPTLPANVADNSPWRPRRTDGTPVTHGNGDDCSILVVRVN